MSLNGVIGQKNQAGTHLEALSLLDNFYSDEDAMDTTERGKLSSVLSISKLQQWIAWQDTFNGAIVAQMLWK